ncbi:MAG: 16S rRNA (uracil(1498)-N(3))-methyltransferase [Spirochaetaceae bacterium]|nr:16S rRNA (uracil(1498)-N(3))-methyltransferase [Spirochaetaceae bacterium]
MNIVLFSAEEISRPPFIGALSLRDERGRHILKILRKKSGDTFGAGIIDGPIGTAVIEEISGDAIRFRFIPERESPPLYPVCLLVGFPRPIQLKRLLRDAASLGVSGIRLMGTELGEKSYMDSTLVERGGAYTSLLEGTVQSGTTKVPALELYRSVEECLASVTGPNMKLVMDNVRPRFSLSQDICKEAGADSGASPVYLAVGSERGWTDRERELFAAEGFLSCGLGGRILRTETAVTAAVSILLGRMGLM